MIDRVTKMAEQPAGRRHHGVILDEASFTRGDLDLSALLDQLDSWERYAVSSKSEVYERAKDATVIVLNKVEINAALIESLPNLALILLTATGTNHVDLVACRQHNISVCNVTNYGTASVAQHVFGLMLALSTNLRAYADEAASGGWSVNSQLTSLSYPITELEGKTLGIVGYGALAKGVETLALAFGMKILIAQRPKGKPQPGRLALTELLPKVDVLSLHCPLVPETYHLINAQAFKAMKSSAVLINTARGGVVDNAALADALIEGEIAGAGIDVLEQEPPTVDHPLLQTRVPNLILTPHIAWAAVQARQRLLDKVADNLQNWLSGKPSNDVTQL